MERIEEQARAMASESSTPAWMLQLSISTISESRGASDASRSGLSFRTAYLRSCSKHRLYSPRQVQLWCLV